MAPLFAVSITRALGTLPLILACLLVLAVCLVGFPLIENYAAWFVLRFVLGFASTTVFIVADSWFILVVPDRLRGRIVGVYGAVLAAGFGVGPLLIGLVGSAGVAPFFVAAAIIAAAALPLGLVRGEAPIFAGHEAAPARSVARRLPDLMAAGLIFGLIFGLSLSLLPIYGLRIGLAEDRVVALVSAMILGSVALQIPVGWLCDHLDRRMLLRACVVVLLGTSLALPFALPLGAAAPAVLAIHGGTMAGIYTIVMVLFGQLLKGPELVGANSAFTAAFGLGSLCGPPLGGALMDLWDPYGLIAAMAGACFVHVVVASTQKERWRRAGSA